LAARSLLSLIGVPDPTELQWTGALLVADAIRDTHRVRLIADAWVKGMSKASKTTKKGRRPARRRGRYR
jgi:hypothetical protein